jgi:hypothetical protein
MGEKREGDGVWNGVKKGMKTLFSPSFLWVMQQQQYCHRHHHLQQIKPKMIRQTHTY